MQRQLEKARDATNTGDWGPMLYCEQNEQFYSDPSDVIDDFGDDLAPEWLFGTTAQRSELDLDNAIEQMEEDTYEDAEVTDVDAIKELQAAFDKFNAKCGIDYYVVNYGVKVRVPNK